MASLLPDIGCPGYSNKHIESKHSGVSDLCRHGYSSEMAMVRWLFEENWD